MLTLDAPCDGHLRELKVHLASWAGPEMPRVGENVTFYGRPGGEGPLLLNSSAQGRAFVGTGMRQPTPSAGQDTGQDTPTAQGTGPGHTRRGALVLVGVGLVAMVALIGVIAVASSSSGRQLTEDQLRPGDCLTGSNLGLGDDAAWPDSFTAVPCTQQHIAEVFFAGNFWPQWVAYPGDYEVYDQAQLRCANALAVYAGLPYRFPLAFDVITPDNTTWSSGDRLAVCVAYKSTVQHPGGAPLDYSIKSRR